MSHPKKAFLGLVNISSQINDLRSGFEKNNCPCYSAALDTGSRLQETAVDELISQETTVSVTVPRWLPSFLYYRLRFLFTSTREKRLEKVLRKALRSCNIFLFMWRTFRDDCSDVILLRNNNKKLIFFTVGSDIYWPEAGNQHFLSLGLQPTKYSDQYLQTVKIEDKLKYLRHAEKYGDLIFSSPALTQLSLRPYYRSRHLIPLHRIKRKAVQRKEDPVVLFAPSNDIYKGTEWIEKAIAELQEEGVKFQYRLVKDLSYDEALKLYSDSDILIGELFYPGGGKQQREALAAGNVVVTCFPDHFRNGLPDDTPFIHADRFTIRDVLKKVILDHNLRQKMADRGRPFVERVNDPVVVCKEMLELLETGESAKLIVPDFLRRHYLPSSDKEVAIINEYTDMVSGCDWYKLHIEPGERAGLIF